MGEDKDGWQVLERCEPDGRLEVVAKDHKGTAIGSAAAMEVDSIYGRRHCKLTDTKVDITPTVVGRTENLIILESGLVR